MSRKKWMYGALFITISIGLFYIFFEHKEPLLKNIQTLALEIKSMPYGWLVMGSITALTSIPPIFGFTFSVLLNGFIYGFPLGCYPSTLGAFLGSLWTLLLMRQSHLLSWLSLSPNHQEKFEAVEQAIGLGGFKMVLLIRLCPIPWQVSNLVLSLCSTVSWQYYIIAAFIACFKYNWEVWVGSQLANLSDPSLPPTTHRITLVTMVIGLIVLACVFGWLYRMTNKILKQHQPVFKYQSV
ncbi:uncharacterized protein B0P05DRAFT_562803 [Gilbertella persicaria]|uniref:uncharacterized protein n=1 Tax=Gilbertella persicaria TaxID=101096 RepID=UPI0022201F65|nr:uncharacterized protein B0P05DRAFT_562803 [Gilbertella persicaria]KAI8051060.1 hypothetical protein B0P05DRAFT_562803 [Gilbertella persicaria]